MKRILLFLALLLAFDTAFGGSLSNEEASALRRDLESLYTAFDRGDPEPIIRRTHASLVHLAGGPEAYSKLTHDLIEQMRATGLEIVSTELGTPTETYPAGDEEVCFVPKVTVMAIDERTIKSTSFMIAIRGKGWKQWSYLDGAGLRSNPELLQVLLPKLDKAVPLPPNTME